MLSLVRGRVVRSLAGRDKDTVLVVVDVVQHGVYLADGKHRPLERPKLKNIAHLAMLNVVISEESMASNRRLRKSLREIDSSAQ